MNLANHRHLLTWLCCSFAAVMAHAQSEEPLYRQRPNDLIVLNKANGGAELEAFPLDFPNRRVPNVLPRGRSLKARLLEGTAGEVEIPYANIERIELFEQRLLKSALEHASKKDFGDAYEYFARIDRDYPELDGYADEFAAMLRAEALERFRAGDQDHALALMQTLYDRAPNTKGLDRAIDTIGESIIAARWKAKDYAGVSRAVKTLGSQFAGLRLGVNERWEQRLRERAVDLTKQAEELFEQGRSREALNTLNQALALEPKSKAIQALLKKLGNDDTTLWVGVWETAAKDATSRLDTPAASRQSRLTGGRLASLEAYPPEGSEYASSLGALRTDAARRKITIGMSGRSDAAFRVARAILEPATPGDPFSLLRSHAELVTVIPSGELVVELNAPHPRPESLASTSLPRGLAGIAEGDWRRVPILSGSTATARYERTTRGGSLTAIEEYVYPSAEEAVDAFQAGRLHVLAEVPLWKRDDVEATPDVQIGRYRLPTLHCLLLSKETALRQRRELRRAICYAVARKESLDELVLGGRPLTGCEVLSAPFPRGTSLSDPLRYAYNVSVEARPYEPRLAALLLAAARATDQDAKKKAEEGEASTAPLQPPVPEVITIAHPPTPTARLAVQSISQMLATVGVETNIIEASEEDLASGTLRHDLRYAEITMSEPLVDAWRLLGPGGIAGGCSPPMLAGLQRVQRAKTFSEATEALSDLHRIAFADLPMIPLWQTTNVYAFNGKLRGLPKRTVDLYQSIDAWRLDSGRRQ